MPAAVDPQSDADVLTGLVVGREAPTGFDRHRGGVLGLLADLDDFASELPRRPQRVEQFQVVVGQQRRRGPSRQSAENVDLRTDRCFNVLWPA